MPSHEYVAALRWQLHSNGYKPVAVYSRGKRPFGTAWQNRARQNPSGAVTEPVNDAALSTGILCDGLRAIDIDVDDSAIASEVERIAYGILGTCPARRRADSARALLLYRAASGEPCKRTIEGTMGNVEALGHGQQFVAFGTHEQGQEYTWAVSPAPYSVDALTAITEEALTAFLGAVASLIGSQAVQPAPVAPTGIVAASVDPALVTDTDRAYAFAACNAEYEKLCNTRRNRNDALNSAANALGELVGNYSLDEQQVILALCEASAMNGYEAKDGKASVMKTIYSGLTSGKAKPRSLPSQTVPVLNPELRASIVAKNLKTTTPQALPAKRSVELVRMAEVVEKPITWLWTGYVPLGKLTLLAGAGGTGKSTLAFSMASIVTNAGVWPDATRCNVAGNALIWSSEDDPADVIKPRLLAMNADVNRVGTIRAVKTLADGEIPFDPARDMDALRDAARAIGGVTLLIIDPIVSAVSGDMHKANDVRRSLQAIVDFAAEMNCAVIGITHFAKSTAGRNPSERVIGSQAFAAFARMVLVAAKDEDTDNRVFTRAKSNISLDDGGFNYTIQEVVLPGGIVTTRIVWGAAIQGTSREILATVEKSDNPSDSQPQRKEAKAFLHEELKAGPRPARELIELAKNQLGISEKTLRTAQHELGIVASKAGYQGLWLWSFPFALSQPVSVPAR
jgi:energy-coupling factor transporter ATP-binding protein EcfA2